MSMSVLVIANDFSAINVAIPTVEKDFSTGINTTQWVVNAYALTFGVMIVTGGRLADMFGRRRAFFIGTAIFASMSALGGAAHESFRASCVAIALMSATFFAAVLYLPQFMQKHLGYSPLEAGVGILPFLGTFALVSFIAGPLYNRVGAKLLAVLGAA